MGQEWKFYTDIKKKNAYPTDWLKNNIYLFLNSLIYATLKQMPLILWLLFLSLGETHDRRCLEVRMRWIWNSSSRMAFWRSKGRCTKRAIPLSYGGPPYNIKLLFPKACDKQFARDGRVVLQSCACACFSFKKFKMTLKPLAWPPNRMARENRPAVFSNM